MGTVRQKSGSGCDLRVPGAVWQPHRAQATRTPVSETQRGSWTLQQAHGSPGGRAPGPGGCPGPRRPSLLTPARESQSSEAQKDPGPETGNGGPATWLVSQASWESKPHLQAPPTPSVPPGQAQVLTRMFPCWISSWEEAAMEEPQPGTCSRRLLGEAPSPMPAPKEALEPQWIPTAP